MKLQEIVSAIVSGDADENIKAVYDAYSTRIKMLRDIKNVTLKSTLKVGTAVEIRDIKPKYLDGIRGTVSLIEPGRGKGYVTVKFDKPTYVRGRMVESSAGIPMSCITVLE